MRSGAHRSSFFELFTFMVGIMLLLLLVRGLG